MKNKQIESTGVIGFDKKITPDKPKSLRPMRSLMAVRSFKPKIAVATMTMVKPELETK